MIPPRAIRLAVIAPSGSGKSTAAAMMREQFAARGLSSEVVKLAAPLYRLQAEVYRTAGREIGPDEQDQEILEAMARFLRRIEPGCIVEDFLARYRRCTAPVALNDDLRDPDTDWPRLHEAGFRVVRVVTPEDVRLRRLRARGDLKSIAHSQLDDDLQRIHADVEIANETDGFDTLAVRVAALVDSEIARARTDSSD